MQHKYVFQLILYILTMNKHQMVVIDCLEDLDETIRRRTLSLLYTMTNANNVTVIVKKLLEFAKKSLDSHMREELIQVNYFSQI